MRRPGPGGPGRRSAGRSRDDPLLSHNIITCNAYRHDFDALRKAPTRIGIAPVTFPGDHGGFLGGEYGQTGEPDAFAATLREVLTA